ncbi:MAG: translation elongation factor Ts [Pseudomonadota bacterium]|nr:translation elongation factor Ts [Pseudomonadota bacterium]
MAISAGMVKEVRERSGAGMMECKKALVETDGDIEAALEYLRKSGAAKAAKRAGRIAAEGAVIAVVDGSRSVLVEVNSETDFVAKDDNFTQFTQSVAAVLLRHRPQDLEALAAAVSDNGESIEEMRTNLITKIGENISVRRFDYVDFDEGIIESYIHGNRIGVLVAMEGGTRDLARDIAMQVAASSPVCIGEDDVTEELLSKEREIQVAQAEQSGKPPQIVERMVDGRLKKFINEITLLGQAFVKDTDRTVAQLLDASDAKVRHFIRYEVGEGIEKKQENFADEVLVQARSAGRS